jgi:hypothetical protein
MVVAILAAIRLTSGLRCDGDHIGCFSVRCAVLFCRPFRPQSVFLGSQGTTLRARPRTTLWTRLRRFGILFERFRILLKTRLGRFPNSTGLLLASGEGERGGVLQLQRALGLVAVKPSEDLRFHLVPIHFQKRGRAKRIIVDVHNT